MKNLITPMLRLCVTESCNHTCIYCRPGGESCHSSHKKEMTVDEIFDMVSILNKNGVESVKVTGGEPFLREDILDILHSIASIDGIKSLELITRHPKSIDFIDKLEEIGVSCLNFSLDTLNTQTFKMISGKDSLEGIIAAIRKASFSKMKLKINMVVMQGINDHEIPAMIKLAGETKAELKLLDLMDIPEDPSFMAKHYLDFNQIIPYLSETAIKVETVTPPGGIGTPMPYFHLANGAKVSIKDARAGTWYGNTCKECKHYPCQDALMALRLTADGFLQRCLIRSDNMDDLLSTYVSKGQIAAEELAQDVLKTFRQAEYAGPIWKP